MTDVVAAVRLARSDAVRVGRFGGVRAEAAAVTAEQAGWAILTGAVIFGGELVVWFQGYLDRSRRQFVRDVRRELRSDLGGRSEEADQSHPQGRSAVAGVERRDVPHHVAAPPAPCPLVGAVGRQTAAPTRPPRVAVHG